MYHLMVENWETEIIILVATEEKNSIYIYIHTFKDDSFYEEESPQALTIVSLATLQLHILLFGMNKLFLLSWILELIN